jgi:hypothetical protein
MRRKLAHLTLPEVRRARIRQHTFPASHLAENAMMSSSEHLCRFASPPRKDAERAKADGLSITKLR